MGPLLLNSLLRELKYAIYNGLEMKLKVTRMSLQHNCVPSAVK